MSKSKLTPPSAPEFWAIYRRDTLEVLWFTLEEGQAAAKALALSSLPEYKDIGISYTLCKHSSEPKNAFNDPN